MDSHKKPRSSDTKSMFNAFFFFLLSFKSETTSVLDLVF